MIVVEISKTWVLSTTRGFYCSRYFWREGGNVFIIPFFFFLLLFFLLFGFLGGLIMQTATGLSSSIDFGFCLYISLDFSTENCLSELWGKKKELSWIVVVFLNGKFMLYYSCLWSLKTTGLVWNPGMKTCIYVCIYTH